MSTQPLSGSPKPQPSRAGAPLAKPAARANAVPPARGTAQAAKHPTGDIDAEDYEKESGLSSNFLIFNAFPSYGISFITHFLIVFLMAFITFSIEKKPIQAELMASVPEDLEELEEIQEDEKPEMDLNTKVTSDAPSEVSHAAEQKVVDVVIPTVVLTIDTDAAQAMIDLQDFGENTAPKADLAKEFGSSVGRGVEGRSQVMKGTFNIEKEGGTPDSEKAVALALAWLAEHQNPDGSWNFNHQTSPRCLGKCGDRGSMVDCTTGATGLALLPFLGAGQTHKQGKYKQVVEKGLYYLMNRMKEQNGMGNLAEGGGNLYSHGICAIVLCEAYAMTHEKVLMRPAQLSLNYTMYAQDPVGGGWRYTAKQAGDTSAVGWQLMALKSGHMAYLQVSPATIQGAMRFLDSVQTDSGSKYGYAGPGAGAATTSVGLLSRMYLGWKKDNPALQRGVEYLAGQGPSNGNMYFNYYATQVMRHAGGEPWEKWNTVMRDSLVENQAKNGHEVGSWFARGGDHGSDVGGRIYCTAMSTMILEVYYRHMPIYGKQAAEEDFPL